MEVLNKLLNIISSATANPILFLVVMGVLLLVTFSGSIWISKLIKNWRTDQANSNKDKDKDKDIDELEDKHAESAKKLRDKLRELGQKEETVSTRIFDKKD